MLIECPDCKREVSDWAICCPRCRSPIAIRKLSIFFTLPYSPGHLFLTWRSKINGIQYFVGTLYALALGLLMFAFSADNEWNGRPDFFFCGFLPFLLLVSRLRLQSIGAKHPILNIVLFGIFLYVTEWILAGLAHLEIIKYTNNAETLVLVPPVVSAWLYLLMAKTLGDRQSRNWMALPIIKWLLPIFCFLLCWIVFAITMTVATDSWVILLKLNQLSNNEFTPEYFLSIQREHFNHLRGYTFGYHVVTGLMLAVRTTVECLILSGLLCVVLRVCSWKVKFWNIFFGFMIISAILASVVTYPMKQKYIRECQFYIWRFEKTPLTTP